MNLNLSLTFASQDFNIFETESHNLEIMLKIIFGNFYHLISFHKILYLKVQGLVKLIFAWLNQSL